MVSQENLPKLVLSLKGCSGAEWLQGDVWEKRNSWGRIGEILLYH